LKDLVLLRKLFLSDNQISKIGSLNYLEALDDLSDLDLCYNPVQKRKYYRYQVIILMRRVIANFHKIGYLQASTIEIFGWCDN